MNDLLGSNNTLVSYLFILLIYIGLYVTMAQVVAPRIEPEFQRSFWVLYAVWAVGTFIFNYVFYLIGIMSFLPWLDNFGHTFIWIGFILGYLYSISYKKPVWQQLVIFGIYSFAVKVIENKFLGTWEFGHFFFVDGNFAYIIGWSCVDACLPLASALVLRLAARFITGLVVPELK